MPEQLITDAIGAARLIGCSERTFHDLRKRADFPKPLKLFPTRPRWRIADVRSWVDAMPTDDGTLPEPPQLPAGKRAKREAAQARRGAGE